MSGSEEKDKKNEIGDLQNNGQGSLFPVEENNDKELVDALIQRVKANPAVAKQLHDVLDVIEDDHNKWRYFERERESASHRIPLDKISLDLESFQNREDEYSEDSVLGIMDAVFSDWFKKPLLSPCILWQNPRGNSVILAGHSRNEAFNRLDKIYRDDMESFSEDVKKIIQKRCQDNNHDYATLPATVQDRCKRHTYYFDKLRCLYIHDINFEDAKTIALMSNALASVETDRERANVYRCMRETGRDHHEIETFGRRCEKSNRSRIRSYAYLAKRGLAMDRIRAFDKGIENKFEVKKIAHRLGELRRKNLDLSDIHENELFDWLVNKWVYGKNKNKWEIYTMDVFIDVVERHIEQLKTNSEFGSDRLLNMSKIKDISYTMKYYYETINAYRSKKKVIMEDFHALRRKISQLKATKNVSEDRRIILQKLEDELNVSFRAIGSCEDINTGADLLFAIEEIYLNPDEEIDKCEKKQTAILKEMRKVEEWYYAFRHKKDIFQEEGKKVIKMDFGW
jgi:hypothetical protein